MTLQQTMVAENINEMVQIDYNEVLSNHRESIKDKGDLCQTCDGKGLFLNMSGFPDKVCSSCEGEGYFE